MKTMSLREACDALAINTTTLNRWLACARMQATSDAIDKRKRVLTLAQVQELAYLHDRKLQDKPVTEAVQIEALRIEVEALKRRVTGLEEIVRGFISSPTSIPRRLSRGHKKSTAELGALLPDELVALQTMLKRHGIPEINVRRAIRNGQLPVIEGDWAWGIKQALDAKGQARFYELYHKRVDFRHCEQCPHEPV